MPDSTPRSGARAAMPRAQRTALTVILGIFCGSWLIVGLLLAPVLGGWRTIAAGALLFTVLPLGVFIRSRSGAHYPGRWTRLLVFRPMWYAQFLLLLSAIAGSVGFIGGVAFGLGGIAGRTAISFIASVYAVLALGGYGGSRRLATVKLDVTLPTLPRELEGLRIAQICDTHVGPHTSRARMSRVATAVRDAKPDLIAVVGDLIDDYAPDLDVYASLLGDLTAPLGVYMVAGNHEVYSGWDALVPRLAAMPMTVLVNESRVVTHNGVSLAVAGTGDPAAGHRAAPGVPAPDIKATVEGIPGGMFTIALAHNPALWPPLAAAGIALTLSGHTHWGQFSIPRAGWSLANPFLELAMGAYRRGDSLLYVSPGTNYWGIPFRIGASAEVTILTLTAGAVPMVRGAQGIDARTLERGG